jgi:hypothetical protein
MLAEVIFAACLKSIASVPQVNLVRVQRKDLFLAEAAFDLHGQEDLLQLAAPGLLRRKKQVASQLHGQRGCALRPAVGVDVGVRRLDRAKQIDAPVALEALVFDGDNGIAQHRRNVGVRDDDAPFQRERADLFPVNIQQNRRGIRAVTGQIVHLRHLDGVHHHQPAHRAQHARGREQQQKHPPRGHLRARIFRPGEREPTRNAHQLLARRDLLLPARRLLVGEDRVQGTFRLAPLRSR